MMDERGSATAAHEERASSDFLIIFLLMLTSRWRIIGQ